MENKIRKIIKLNIICYINNFLYILVSNNIYIDGYISLWILSPFIFMVLTSFILENKYHNEHLYLKKYGWWDYGIRFVGMCVAFTELGLDFYVKLVIIILLFTINNIIEQIMLKLEPKTLKNSKMNIDKSKVNLSEGNRSTFIGIFSILATSLYFGIIWGKFGEQNNIEIILGVIYFMFFTGMEFLKINIFYLDRRLTNKLLVRNIGTFFIGLSLWIIQKSLFKEVIYDNLSAIIIIISLGPSIETTRNIAVNYQKGFIDRQ